jgi:catechol 2,3-dioxygenase-like lactoylglutathione lyase family enzyme
MLHERRVLFTADFTDPSDNAGSSVGKPPTFLYAQGTDKEEKVDLRLDLIGIVARDMRASLEFYRRLGLDIPEGAEDEAHAEATTPSGLRVAWDTAELIRQIDPGWTDPSGGHRVALAFLCPDPASVDAKYEELAALGFGHKDPWDAFWGQRYAIVKDPDGNHIDLFASL